MSARVRDAQHRGLPRAGRPGDRSEPTRPRDRTRCGELRLVKTVEAICGCRRPAQFVGVSDRPDVARPSMRAATRIFRRTVSVAMNTFR